MFHIQTYHFRMIVVIDHLTSTVVLVETRMGVVGIIAVGCVGVVGIDCVGWGVRSARGTVDVVAVVACCAAAVVDDVVVAVVVRRSICRNILNMIMVDKIVIVGMVLILMLAVVIRR